MKYYVYGFIALLLSAVIFSTMLFNATAQVADSYSSSGAWEPPKDFVDPVTIKIQEFKSLNFTDAQITAKLNELGMGWDPKTGAKWLGRALTTEELAKMPDRMPAKAPVEEKTSADGYATLLQADRTSVMRTDAASWTGVSSEVISGSMGISSGQTLYHYLCVQLGRLDAASNWVETVLTHNLGEDYTWCTYDNDEGYWIIFGTKNTAITSADTYTIMLDGTQDQYGWNYEVWINYQWARAGHLSNLYNQAGFQKEVYSNSGTYTSDTYHSVFYRNWLHNAQGWPYWTNSVNTWWSRVDPVQESHTMSAVSYRWETWV